MARAKFKQRGNGQGSIIEIKPQEGKSKPKNRFRARVTTDWKPDEKTGKRKQVLKDIGRYETRREAEAALSEYFSNPYDLSKKDMTFKECADEWFEDYRKRLTGVASERTVINAIEYMTAIYHLKMRDINAKTLELTIENATRIQTRGKDKGKPKEASADMKARMKSVFNLMYDWAVARDIVSRNYANDFKLSKKIIEQREKDKRVNHIFENAEVEKLWENVNKVQFVDVLLIGMYSGWRPQELAILKVEDIDLQRQTMKGGLKTKAGRNREVPIHPVIKNLVINRYNEAVQMGSDHLFNDPEGQRGTHLTYDKWFKRFKDIIKALDLPEHHPHEVRHHFITLAKVYGVNEYMLKKMVGHTVRDITEDTYTHRKAVEFAREIRKIKKYLPEDVEIEDFDDSEYE